MAGQVVVYVDTTSVTVIVEEAGELLAIADCGMVSVVWYEVVTVETVLYELVKVELPEVYTELAGQVVVYVDTTSVTVVVRAGELLADDVTPP